MKSIYSIYFFSMFISFCFSQEIKTMGNDGSAVIAPPAPPKVVVNDNTIFEKVDVEPEFTKGKPVFYIAQFIEYTDEARLNNIQGSILIKFVVEKDGTVNNVRVAGRKLGYGLDEMVINTVRKTSGLWKPALIDDKPVRYYYRLPVTLKLPQEDPEPTDIPE